MSSRYAPAARRPAYPTLTRPRDGHVIAGVAGGLAEHLGVDVLIVRATFAGLSLLSGFGAAAYAGLWMFTSVDDAGTAAPASRWNFPRWVDVVLAGAAVLAALSGVSLVSGLAVPALVPLIVAASGAFLAWLAYDRGVDSWLGGASVAVGALLVIAGVVITVWRWDGTTNFGPALLAVFLTFVGLGALVVPLVLKLWRSLAEQRAAKVAADERAEIASRLHDSVLQTLALIQKRSEDPREVARLARTQERELRAWLFDADSATPTTVFGALEAACGEVEDLFDLRISLVTVGSDAPLADATKLAVQAAREAMVNAGKHAGVDTVDVYAEVLAGELTVFVRDRGAGFDPDTVPADRHGISDSIRARMDTARGTARITSAPGQGTEVELAVAL
ncbi:ATP-binding protein [uncultured Corynebacterium sp.]|uniref:ATP-binding protein n=1 Tax=uncultured Corynebacterium sp. TaxID=159447 RepID=UPI0025F7E807|nr:ATP-binding protein [uncultured Corynebacterium sp.]